MNCYSKRFCNFICVDIWFNFLFALIFGFYASEGFRGSSDVLHWNQKEQLGGTTTHDKEDEKIIATSEVTIIATCMA